MVRTVKAKAVRPLKKGETAMVLPGPTGAEPWEVWILGITAPAECVQVSATPPENRLRKNATLALPVAEVFCLPLWLNETETKALAEMIPLQVELRGLQPRGAAPAVFDWSVVASEEKRTLVMVGILPSTLAEEIHAEAYDAFDLSARYLPLPENTLTLWQEQDHLVVAITHGKNLVYFQALTEARLTERQLQDLQCIRTTLAMQGILAPLQQVMLWMETTPAELASLQTALQLPVRHAPRPAPRTPSPAWTLTPASVGEARRVREVQRWQKRGALLALALYLLVVIGMVSRLFLTSLKVDDLHHWQASNTDALNLVRDTRASWKDLRPVVEENSYPLELLLHVSESIPADQLHLTLFKVSDDGHVHLDGEAKNVAAAFQFADKLKKDSRLSDYTWEMTQPTMAANDLAKFNLEGTRAN